MMDKEVKLKLLEELMGLMDSSIAEKIKPKSLDEEKVQVTEIEQKEMPVDALKEKLKEKMMGSDVEEIEVAMPESEDDEGEDYEDESQMSDFEKKLNALKKKA